MSLKQYENESMLTASVFRYFEAGMGPSCSSLAEPQPMHLLLSGQALTPAAALNLRNSPK
jgi:hypothetical protein